MKLRIRPQFSTVEFRELISNLISHISGYKIHADIKVKP